MQAHSTHTVLSHYIALRHIASHFVTLCYMVPSASAPRSASESLGSETLAFGAGPDRLGTLVLVLVLVSVLVLASAPAHLPQPWPKPDPAVASRCVEPGRKCRR